MSHAVCLRSAAARGPVPVAGHCWPIPLQETLNTQRQVWLNLCGVSGSWCTQGFFWALWVSLVCTGLILKMISPLLPSCWGFFFAFGCRVSFLWWDPIFSCWWLFNSELQFWTNTRILELTPSRANTIIRCHFLHRGLGCKSRKSRNTWSNRKVWPWSTKWSRAKANFAKRTHWSQKTPSSNNKRDDSAHGHHQMVNTEIRLILLFAV